MTTTIADVLKKIDDDLAWRGPGGGLMGNIVLSREQAAYLHDWTIMLALERDQLVAEVERLTASLRMTNGGERELSAFLKLEADFNKHLRAEIERLNLHCEHQNGLLEDKVERLTAALQLFMNQPWQPIDRDNMEFQVTVTCHVRDALLAALEPKPPAMTSG